MSVHMTSVIVAGCKGSRNAPGMIVGIGRKVDDSATTPDPE